MNTLRALLAAVVLGLALVGCGSVVDAPASSPAPATSASADEVMPATIDIPAISARSTLVPLGINDDGSPQVPPDDQPMQAGWYKYSPVPGQKGPAVILGHINGHHQAGIFSRLAELKAGDTVNVTLDDGTVVAFEISRVQQTAKTNFPTDDVYGATQDPQIRLISCGGQYDPANRRYLGSVIAYGARMS